VLVRVMTTRTILRIVDASGGERVRRMTMMRIRVREMLKIAACAILSGRGSAGVVTIREGMPSMRVAELREALMICRACGVGIPCGSNGNIVAGGLGKAVNSTGGRSNSTAVTTEKRESTRNDRDRGVFAVVI